VGHQTWVFIFRARVRGLSLKRPAPLQPASPSRICTGAAGFPPPSDSGHGTPAHLHDETASRGLDDLLSMGRDTGRVGMPPSRTQMAGPRAGDDDGRPLPLALPASFQILALRWAEILRFAGDAMIGADSAGSSSESSRAHQNADTGCHFARFHWRTNYHSKPKFITSKSLFGVPPSGGQKTRSNRKPLKGTPNDDALEGVHSCFLRLCILAALRKSFHRP